MRAGWLVTLLALAAVHAALADEGQSYYERHVDRVTASPGPVAGTGILSDASIFRVDLSAPNATAGAVVQVDASGAATAPFYLRYHRPGEPSQSTLLPSTRPTILLHGPGAWYVEIDPAAGANVHILATFRGFVGDPDGGVPAIFALGDVEIDRACALPGACLP